MDDGETPIEDAALRDALRKRGRGIAIRTVALAVGLTAVVWLV
jgi:hypothetical protein